MLHFPVSDILAVPCTTFYKKKCHEATEQSTCGLLDTIAAGEVSNVGERDEDDGDALEKEHAHDVPIDELDIKNMLQVNCAKTDSVPGNVKNNIQ